MSEKDMVEEINEFLDSLLFKTPEEAGQFGRWLQEHIKPAMEFFDEAVAMACEMDLEIWMRDGTTRRARDIFTTWTPSTKN